MTTDIGKNLQLKEKTSHGTSDFPVALYDNLFESWENFFFYPHWHEEAEILYIIEGKMELVINQLSWTLRAGSVVLIPPNIIHLARRIHDGRCLFGTIVFSPVFLKSFQEDVVQQQLTTFINEDFSPAFLILSNNEQQRQITQLIRSFVTTFSQKGKYRELFLKGLLFQLLAEILGYGSKKQMKKIDLEKEKQKRILLFIEAHYMEKLNLADLADVLNFSQEHFSRFFKQHFKIAPMHYLNQYRIQRGAVLLSTTELTVMEIADKTGFQNSNYFSAVFRKNFESSPTEFRKNQEIAKFYQDF